MPDIFCPPIRTLPSDGSRKPETVSKSSFATTRRPKETKKLTCLYFNIYVFCGIKSPNAIDTPCVHVCNYLILFQYILIPITNERRINPAPAYFYVYNHAVSMVSILARAFKTMRLRWPRVQFRRQTTRINCLRNRFSFIRIEI